MERTRNTKGPLQHSLTNVTLVAGRGSTAGRGNSDACDAWNGGEGGIGDRGSRAERREGRSGEASLTGMMWGDEKFVVDRTTLGGLLNRLGNCTLPTLQGGYGIGPA